MALFVELQKPSPKSVLKCIILGNISVKQKKLSNDLFCIDMKYWVFRKYNFLKCS